MSAPQDTLTEQDPDYVSSVPKNEVQQKALEQNARTNTARKLKDIFDREFSKEIDLKEKEVLEIQNRLQKSLKTLHLLRYVIVTDYYTRKQCQLPDVQVESKQNRIHPAIKQLIGKCPRGIKSNFIDTPSSAENKQSIESEIEKASSSTNVESSVDKESENNAQNRNKRSLEEDAESKEPPKKIPRYIPPKNSSPEPPIPSRGVHNKIRRKVIIGNISKWIPPDWRDDEASHKWTVYVRRCKDDVDVSEIVSKVRFFLHPTYKPHDVVEITSSPFHLTRRGWGEFPIRVQIHFRNPLDKPKDVIHHLKLDQTYTGLQTLGSEAVYGFWLHSTGLSCSEIRDRVEISVDYSEKLTPSKSEPVEECIKHDTESINDTKVSDKISELKLCIRNEHDYAMMDYVVGNNRTIVHLPNGHSETEQNGLQTSNPKDNGISPINGVDKMTEEELGIVASSINKTNKAQSITTTEMNFKNCPSKTQLLNISIPPTFEPKEKKVLILKNNKLIPSSVSDSKNHVDNTEPSKQSFLDKTIVTKTINNAKAISLSANSFTFNTNCNIPALQIVESNNDSLYKNGNNDLCESFVDKERKIKTGERERQKIIKKDIWEEIMKSITNYKFGDTVNLVKFIMERVPLITPEASDPEYKRIHPYACASLDEFLACNVGKQKYIEWYRAKMVRSFLKKCITSNEDLWTIKEILIWARLHGYTPVVSISNYGRKTQSSKSAVEESKSANTIQCTRTEMTELEDWFLKCQTKTDSHSDVEIDVEGVEEETINLKKPLRVRKPSESNEENEDSNFLELPKELEQLYSYVTEVTRKGNGTKLSNETIIPGVKHCNAARVMMKAVQCLVRDITRLAHAQTLERIRNSDSHNFSSPTITQCDVKGALMMREEFDIFTNVGLGTKQKVVDWNSE